MDIATTIALSRLVAAAARHGRHRRQHRQRRHPRLSRPSACCSATGWRGRPRRGRAPRRQCAGLHTGPRHLARHRARPAHAIPAIRSTSPSATDGLLHRADAARPAADARRPFRAAANGTVADGQGEPLLDVDRPADPDRHRRQHAHCRRRRHADQRERPDRPDRRGRARQPAGHAAEGSRLFDANGPTTPLAAPEIVQGAIEDSNVQPILEMTRMMDDLREFQFVTPVRAGRNRPPARRDRQDHAEAQLIPIPNPDRR